MKKLIKRSIFTKKLLILYFLVQTTNYRIFIEFYKIQKIEKKFKLNTKFLFYFENTEINVLNKILIFVKKC